MTPTRSEPPFHDGDRDAELRALLRSVCECPAPPFQEEERARHVAGLAARLGLTPERDGEGNVLIPLPGGNGPRVALVAHLDTVFAEGTDVTVREEAEDRWCAPGIGDNSTSVAVLLQLAADVARGADPARPHCLLAFTVGEEGLGDLRGVRRLVRERGASLDVLLAVDGHVGGVVNAGVGSTRYRVAFRGPGGHAWGDYPTPSALHALGDAMHAIQRVPVPSEPRSSINIGTAAGGSAVNAIAETAHLTLDLRSVDAGTLNRMAAEVEKRVRSVARRHQLDVTLERVGDRPAGRSDDGRLTQIVRKALQERGLKAHVGASSTDANVAMAANVPAIAFGVYRGGDAHRLSEWMDPTSLTQGADLLRDVLAELRRWTATEASSAARSS